MRFLEFLKTINEDIKVGVRNEEIWYDYLKEKYGDKNTDNLFVTFVNVDKVGINPKSQYDTPIGVYAYPLDYVLEEEDVPFRGEGVNKSKKIKILKASGKNFIDGDISKSQYNDNVKYIKQKFNIEDDEINMWENKSRKKTNFGKLWNVTRMLSLKISKPSKEKKDANELSNDELFDELQGTSKDPAKNSVVVWNKILQLLGYDYVVDMGDGIIHPNEPTQAVFLKTTSYKVIDEHYIDTETKFKETQSKDVSKLIDSISHGIWNRELINKVLETKQYRYLKLLDTNDNDALLRVIGVDFELFKKIIKYFYKNDKLENFEMYFRKAQNMFHPSKEDSEKILSYLIDLDDDRMYNKNFDTNRFRSYLKHIYSGKNTIVKKFEKEFGEAHF